VYVRGQASAAERAEASAAFARHCGSVTAASSPHAGQRSLVRQAAWPHPAALRPLLLDSRRAALGLEVSLVEGYVAELAALQATGTLSSRNQISQRIPVR